MPYRFEIYKDKKEEFRVRFRAPNGEKMFSSEGYTSKASAKGAIRSIVKHGGKAVIDDTTKAAKAGKPAKKAAKKAPAKAKKAAPKPAPAPMIPPPAPMKVTP
ncbi:MAG: YegP family protein [Pseudorhodoplanes sp.]